MRRVYRRILIKNVVRENTNNIPNIALKSLSMKTSSVNNLKTPLDVLFHSTWCSVVTQILLRITWTFTCTTRKIYKLFALHMIKIFTDIICSSHLLHHPNVTILFFLTMILSTLVSFSHRGSWNRIHGEKEFVEASQHNCYFSRETPKPMEVCKSNILSFDIKICIWTDVVRDVVMTEIAGQWTYRSPGYKCALFMI